MGQAEIKFHKFTGGSQGKEETFTIDPERKLFYWIYCGKNFMAVHVSLRRDRARRQTQTLAGITIFQFRHRLWGFPSRWVSQAFEKFEMDEKWRNEARWEAEPSRHENFQAKPRNSCRSSESPALVRIRMALGMHMKVIKSKLDSNLFEPIVLLVFCFWKSPRPINSESH